MTPTRYEEQINEKHPESGSISRRADVAKKWSAFFVRRIHYCNNVACLYPGKRACTRHLTRHTVMEQVKNDIVSGGLVRYFAFVGRKLCVVLQSEH
jgi:hypothetical protein